MRIFKRVVIVFVSLFVLTGVVGFLIFPYILKAVIMSKGSEALNRKLTIEKIDINPYKLTVKITGFSLSEPSGKETFVSFKELFVNINGSYSLAKRSLILETVNLDGLYAGITRHPDNTYNFTDLIKEKKEPDPNEEPFHFSVSNINLTHGSLDFRDEPVKAEHEVRDILLAVPFVSNIDHDVQSYVKPAFSATVNGHKFALEGRTKPFDNSKTTSLDIVLADVDIPSYMKYVPVKLNGELASAKLDTKISLDFVMAKKGESPTLKLSGDVTLRDTVIKDSRKNTVLSVPSLAVALADSEPLKSDIHFSRILMTKPVLVIDRNKKGDLNILGILPKGGKKKEPEKKEENSPEKANNPLKLKIDECVLDAADIAYSDAVPSDRVKIRVSPLTIKVTNFSNQKNEKATIDVAVNLDKKKGSLSVVGPVGIDPLQADLTLDLKDIAIRTFQPYFTDQIKIDVTKGTIGTKGRLNLVMDKAGKPKVTYEGEIGVSRLATIDKARANDFIKWRQLYFDRIKTGFNPFFLDIKGISLTDYYAKLVVNNDGSMNVSDIFGDSKGGKKKSAKQEKTKTAKKKSSDPLKDIRIGKVSFQGGSVDFADNKIQPNFSVNIKKLTGSVTGLSSEQISRAKVDLRGNFGYGSPVLIAGRINPLTTDVFLDLLVRFKDIELSPTTPYTSTFLGYPVSKGKLDLNVSYLIDKGNLKAENKISFNQLTFGDKVESEQAIKAPVKLAVALLTDRNGQINLDVPLSGSLKDPKFKVWPVVWQVFKNLIVKAVMSPFSLLASLGADEETSFVEFDYGSSAVNEASMKKVETMAKALYDRPNLNMDIEPYVDLEKDKESLKEVEMLKRVKAQKLKASLAKGGPAISLDQVTVGDEEYLVYLTQAYHAEPFPKPRTEGGKVKPLVREEMEKLMLSSIDIGESELRQLASKRAETVKELLLKSGQVDGGRIFLVEPKTLNPEKKEKFKDSRVNFVLK